jgi:hypothetical protein
LAVGRVNTRRAHVIALANLEDVVLSVVGGVVLASETVIDVLTESLLVLTSGVTDLHAEGTATHEIGPVNDLLVGGIVATVAREGVRVHQTTEWVTAQVGTVGIKLSSVIVSSHVNLGLINESNDLNVIGCLNELDTSQSTARDQASSVPRLSAPGNFLLLGITDGGVRLGGSPQTEVVNVVDERSLAHRLLVLGGAVADIVAYLRATDGGGIIINLVWDARRVSIVLVNERGGVSGIGLSEDDGGSGDGQKCRKSGTRHVSSI